MTKTSRSEKPRWTAGLLLAGLTAAAWAFRRTGPKGEPKTKRVAGGKTQGERAIERPTWRDWKEILKRVYKALGDDRLLAVAAGVVFYGLLAFFPAITAFVSFFALIADPARISENLSLASAVLPEGGMEIVRSQIDRILAKGGGQLSLTFIFSILLAMWSANAGMKALMDALNVTYNVPEERGFLRLNGLSLLLTLGAMGMMLLAIGCVVVFPLIFAFFGLGSWGETLASWLRWPLLFGGMLFALAVLYRYGPSPHGARWRWITPGPVLASVLWILGSAALSYYLANFANYDATYGSLGAAIGLMMWMWMSSIVILLGAQLNNTLHSWNDQPERPMQQTQLQTHAARRASTG